MAGLHWNQGRPKTFIQTGNEVRMKKIILLLSLFLVSGCCAVEPASFDVDGRTATYRHGKAMFKVVKADAEKQCGKKGMIAKHDHTYCAQENCTSTFLCIGNPATDD